jgi:hypothetical protein
MPMRKVYTKVRGKYIQNLEILVKYRPCACLEGVVYIGHLVEEDGVEVERVEAVACKRCKLH